MKTALLIVSRALASQPAFAVSEPIKKATTVYWKAAYDDNYGRNRSRGVPA